MDKKTAIDNLNNLFVFVRDKDRVLYGISRIPLQTQDFYPIVPKNMALDTIVADSLNTLLKEPVNAKSNLLQDWRGINYDGSALTLKIPASIADELAEAGLQFPGSQTSHAAKLR